MAGAGERVPYVSDPDFTLWVGDVREVLAEMPDGSVDCCVTSPPYWGLRDYGHDGQIGLEHTPEEYVAEMVVVFAQVRRVLSDSGTCWLNLGDSYNNRARTRETNHQPSLNNFVDGESWAMRAARGGVRMSIAGDGLKEKDLCGIPWMVAFALRADGWYLRSDIIWSKPNPMPESVTDRPTKSHEYVFLLTKSPRYFYDATAIAEPAAWERWGDQSVGSGSNPNGWIKPKSKQELVGKRTYDGFNGRWNESVANGTAGKTRNARSVWEIATQPYPDAHFATFPEALPERCIKAGCPAGGTVLDPFMGSGTTALVARRLGRKSVGIELNPEYARLAAKRLQQLSLLA